MKTKSSIQEFTETLQAEAPNYGVTLRRETVEKLSRFYELLNAWNPRLHLVAPTSPQEFATRHILESLFLLQYLPGDARVADVGSGAGLPIIPCLIARTDIDAVLVEASGKKAVFLREVLTQLSLTTRATVMAERFENIAAPEVGFVSSRALERFEIMLPRLIAWAPARATLLLFGGAGIGDRLKKFGVPTTSTLIPNSTRRFLFKVSKV